MVRYLISLVAQWCLTLCNPMDYSTPGLPVHHQLPGLPRLTSVESVMPSNHLILCHPLLLLPSILPSIKVFSNELVLCIRWPKDWSFSFSISPSNEYSGLISFKIGWLDLLAVQGTLKSLHQHHSSKALCLVSHSIQVGPQYILVGWPSSGGTFCFAHWRHSLEDKVSFHLLDEVSPKVAFLPTWLYKS